MRGTKEMHIKAGIQKEKIFSLSLYCLFVMFMIFVIGNKRNLHVDEAFSYGLANHDGMAVNIEEGYTYQPADGIWLDYMTVNRGERFCYRNVWENQASDVHPPLYYVLLHTICSLFPGHFSMWFAGLINIVFACGTLFFLRKLALLFSDNEKLQRLLSIAFISSAGVLSAVGFLRMYIVAMFWVTALTYILLKRFEGNGWRFYVALFFCMVCGALTHYYCVLYAVSVSVAYGSLLLCRKAWKETGLFCLTQGLSGIVAICCFPAMLQHVFSGYRGKEAFGNLEQSLSEQGLGRITVYLEKLDEHLFGSIAAYFVAGAIIWLLVFGVQKFQEHLTDDKRVVTDRYFCVIVAEVLYFLVVAFSSAFLSDRYMTPVYAVLFLATIITVNGLRCEEWANLHRSSEPLLRAAAEHSEDDCLFIYDRNWHILPAYFEVSNYRSVTFLREEHLERLDSMELSSRDELIVVTDGENPEAVKQIMDRCPLLDSYEYLGQYESTTTYYLYGE